MEDNKLIAEFMGCVENPNNGVWNTECPFEGKGHHLETMKYHSSWDWLMPVVEKIRNCKCYDKGDVFNYHFIIYNNRAEYYPGGYSKKPSKIFLGYGKEGTYKAVVEFINQYNK